MRLKLNHLFEIKDNKIILNDISFSITDNEFLSIVSEDEEVLSSIARIILKDDPKSGEIRLDEREITSLKPYDRSIAVSTFSPVINDKITIYDNIALPLRSKNMKEEAVEEKMDGLIKAFNLDVIAGENPRQISFYQKLLVSLARSVVDNPKVVILLDPLRNLDESRHDDYLKALKDAKTFLENPVIIYIGRVTNMTTRVISISKDGKILDNNMKNVCLYHPNSRITASLSNNSDIDESEFEDSKSKISDQYILLDTIEKDGSIYYLDSRINIDPVYKRRFLSNAPIKHMCLKPELLSPRNTGVSIELKVSNIEYLSHDCLRIEIGNSHFIKYDTKEFYKGMKLFYPRDEIVYLDQNLDRINTLYNVHSGNLNIKVLNGARGLIQVGNAQIETFMSIQSAIKTIVLRDDVIHSLGDNKSSCIHMKKMKSFEEFSDYYLISGYLTGGSDIAFIRLSKDKNPLFEKEILIKTNKDSFKNSYSN